MREVGGRHSTKESSEPLPYGRPWYVQPFLIVDYLLIELTVLTEADVRKELAKEEESRLSNGGIALHQTSASSFVVLGLELEDTQ